MDNKENNITKKLNHNFMPLGFKAMIIENAARTIPFKAIRAVHNPMLVLKILSFTLNIFVCLSINNSLIKVFDYDL